MAQNISIMQNGIVPYLYINWKWP